GPSALGSGCEHMRHLRALLKQVLRVAIDFRKYQQRGSQCGRQPQEQKNQSKRRSRSRDEGPAQAVRQKPEPRPAQCLSDDRQSQPEEPSNRQRKSEIQERDGQPFAQKLFDRLIQRARGPKIALDERSKIMGVKTRDIGVSLACLTYGLDALS